jgi:hypothetical protein
VGPHPIHVGHFRFLVDLHSCLGVRDCPVKIVKMLKGAAHIVQYVRLPEAIADVAGEAKCLLVEFDGLVVFAR